MPSYENEKVEIIGCYYLHTFHASENPSTRKELFVFHSTELRLLTYRYYRYGCFEDRDTEYKGESAEKYESKGS